MIPVIFGCIICGHAIYGYESSAEGSWSKEFRANRAFQAYNKDPRLTPSVYSNPEGVFISGVGRYDDPNCGTWIAPLDPAMRWDDQDCIFQACDELPVMSQRPENNRQGFLFHDACWRLLQKASEPETVPLERLLMICRSLLFPLRGISVCWGHNHRGLIPFDSQHHFQWEDRLLKQKSGSERYEYASENPYDVPEISESLEMRMTNPPRSFAQTQIGDCFSMLPWDILEVIAINLPTRGALAMRRACRAFLSVVTSQILQGFSISTQSGARICFREAKQRVKRLDFYISAHC